MEDELRQAVEKELMNYLPEMFFNAQSINPKQCADIYTPILSKAIITLIRKRDKKIEEDLDAYMGVELETKGVAYWKE